jgi:hypothetical protein
MNKRWKIVIAVFVIFIGLGLIFLNGWCAKRVIPVVVPTQKKIARHVPSWANYQGIEKEFKRLAGHGEGGDQDFPALGLSADGEPSIATGLNQQITEIQRIFGAENAVRQVEINRELARFAEQLKREKDARIHETEQQLTDSLNSDIQEKKAIYAKNLTECWRSLENEQQVNLSSLQLKLYINDLSNDPVEKERVKDQTQLKINQIRRQIANKYELEKEKLALELDGYLKQRNEEFNNNLNTFRAEQEQYCQEQINILKTRMEDEYRAWYSRWQGESQRAIQLRNESALKQR